MERAKSERKGCDGRCVYRSASSNVLVWDSVMLRVVWNHFREMDALVMTRCSLDTPFASMSHDQLARTEFQKVPH